MHRHWKPVLGGIAAMALGVSALSAVGAHAEPGSASEVGSAAAPGAPARAGSLELLTDPFLQAPTPDGVSVVWMTEYAGDDHVVLLGAAVADLDDEQLAAAAQGSVPAGVRAFPAASTRLSRTAEDAGSQLADKPTAEEGIVAREVHRHEAVVSGLAPATRTPYRIVSTDGTSFAASGVFELSPAAQPGEAQQILLTSDHQAMVNTPANLQQAHETIGDIDAVFVAGDLVNIPDRASEWFDDARGSAFFPVLQGRAGRVSTGGVEYVGGEIVQSAPIFPAIGNHEVQGRIDGATGLNASFNSPIPRAVAERHYRKVEATVNPDKDPAVKDRWMEDNSFSTRTYEEIFTLPEDSPGGEKYYATTVGDVRLVSLFSTRIWRGTTANPDPAERTSSSRYQEARTALDDPMAQGYGEHVFESLESGSEQLAWLEEELASPEFRDAPIKVVMLHEGPQGLGDNVMPVFAHPERIEARDAEGKLSSVRYEYRTEDNMLVRDLQPLLEDAGADLVLNGHSHLWNRFRAASGTNFLETSNTGNTYGAYHGLSNRTRPVPPAPWDASNYLAIGNPGGLKPIVPNVEPFLNPDGVPLPFVQDNNLAVFAALDTGTREVTSWAYDVKQPDVAPWVIDRFTVGDPRSEPEDPDPVDPPTTTPPTTPPTTPTPPPTTDAPRVTATTASRATFGTATRITGTVTGRTGDRIDGTVTITRDGTELASGAVRDGAYSVKLGRRSLRPGQHDLEVRFTGPGSAASSTGLALTVAKARSRVRATAPKRIAAGRTLDVRVRVRARGVTPSGKVRIKFRGTTVAAGSAGKRWPTLSVPARALGAPGRKRLLVTYGGSALVARDKDRVVVTVRR